MSYLRYSVDTSSLIEMRRKVPRDIFREFWLRFEERVDRSVIVASREVYEELSKRSDEVFAWAKARRSMFVETDRELIDAQREIVHCMPELVDTRKGKSKADPWVIALAKVRGLTVISEEIPVASDPNARPRIPDACNRFGIRCVSLFGMARMEEWRFR